MGPHGLQKRLMTPLDDFFSSRLFFWPAPSEQIIEFLDAFVELMGVHGDHGGGLMVASLLINGGPLKFRLASRGPKRDLNHHPSHNKKH